MPKYNKEKIKNTSETYKFLFDARDVPFVVQYRTKLFSKKIKEIQINVYTHTWRQGDKLYKIASKYYGDFRLWWTIAFVNKIACEADLKYGDRIVIPVNPTDITRNI